MNRRDFPGAPPRVDVASGRPATAWGDFTEYAVEDEES